MKSFDTFVINATRTSSITLFLTGIGLIVIPIAIASACSLSIGIEGIYEINMQKYNKYKKQYEKDRETYESFDKFHGKSLQDNLVDKK